MDRNDFIEKIIDENILYPKICEFILVKNEF